MVGTTRSSTRPHTFNGKFRCVVGHEYWHNSEFVFPQHNPDKKKCGAYRMLYGFNFAHGGIIFEKSDYNLAIGSRRVFGSMIADYDDAPSDYHAFLETNQRTWFTANTPRLVELYTQFTYGHVDMMEGAKDLVLLPHPKRRLREECLKIMLADDSVGEECWTVSNLLSQKPDEMLEDKSVDKVRGCRTIINLGTPASLQTVPWSASVKEAKAFKEFKYKGCTAVFVASPACSKVTDALLSVWDSKYPVRLIIFSDDAVLAIIIDGERHVYNIDLRLNDLCKGDELFECFMRCNRCPQDVMKAIWAQIYAPLRIDSYDRKSSILLVVLKAWLQSGIGVTSDVNTDTHFFAFVNVVDKLSTIRCIEDVRSAYEDLGHSITWERCHKIEHMQFLKKSLVWTAGGYRAMLNLGVIFRASGTCRGDLPWSGSIADRARDFQASLMNGLLHGVVNKTLDYLKGSGSVRELDVHKYVNAYNDGDLDVEVVVEDEDMFRRYDLTSSEIDEITALIRTLDLGVTIHCVAAHKVLLLDYGLDGRIE